MRIATALLVLGFILLGIGLVGAVEFCTATTPPETCPSTLAVDASGFAIVAGVVLVPVSTVKIFIDRRRGRREVVPLPTQDMAASSMPAITVPPEHAATIRIWSGGIYDFWFTEDEVLRVRAVSNLAIAISAVLVGVGLVFGALGGIIGVLISGVILQRSAKSMRTHLYAMSGAELTGMKLITSRTPYSTIWKAELRSKSLVLALPRRRIRLRLPQTVRSQTEMLLRAKLGEKLTITTL